MLITKHSEIYDVFYSAYSCVHACISCRNLTECFTLFNVLCVERQYLFLDASRVTTYSADVTTKLKSHVTRILQSAPLGSCKPTATSRVQFKAYLEDGKEKG